MELNFDNYFRDCFKLAKTNDLLILLTLHQTSNKEYLLNKIVPYTLPPRIYGDYLIAGLCNLEEELMILFAKKYDTSIAYFLVDLEKKGFVGKANKSKNLITGNFEGRLAEIVDKNKILGIRFDALTSEHVVNLLIKENPFLYKRSIGIIGLGKIGFKISIALLECGNSIEINSRNFSEVNEKCKCMDLIKPNTTIAKPIPHKTIEACISNKDILITATNSKEIINMSNCKFIKKNSLILMIGHNEINEEALVYLRENKNVRINRVDITLSLSQYINRLINTKEIEPQRNKCGEYFLSSGGYLAQKGDYIVDDASNPKMIYGYIKKDGSFLRKFKNFEFKKGGLF